MTAHTVTVSRDFVNLKVFRFARNQREAGIDHLQWEERSKPPRPILHDIAFGVSIASALLLAVVVI